MFGPSMRSDSFELPPVPCTDSRNSVPQVLGSSNRHACDAVMMDCRSVGILGSITLLFVCFSCFKRSNQSRSCCNLDMENV
jgi:hypothetical protein